MLSRSERIVKPLKPVNVASGFPGITEEKYKKGVKTLTKSDGLLKSNNGSKHKKKLDETAKKLSSTKPKASQKNHGTHSNKNIFHNNQIIQNNTYKVKSTKSMRQQQKCVSEIYGEASAEQVLSDKSDDILFCYEDLSRRVVEDLNKSQKTSMYDSCAIDVQEYKLKRCLEERIAEVQIWSAILCNILEKLIQEINQLERESKTLQIVLLRVDIEKSDHVLNTVRPLLGKKDDVELELQKELKLLKTHRSRFQQKLYELEAKIKEMQHFVKQLKEEIIEKKYNVYKDKKSLYETKPVKNTTTSKRRNTKGYRQGSYLEWKTKCSLLQETGQNMISQAIDLREKLKESRVRLSHTVQSQAFVVESALRRRVNRNQYQLEGLRLRAEELRRDSIQLTKELERTEFALVEAIERQSLLEIRLSERNIKPTGEICDDTANLTFSMEIERAKFVIQQLEENYQSLSNTKASVQNAHQKLTLSMEDLEDIISLDLDRLRKRQGSQGKDDKHIIKARKPYFYTLETIPEEDEEIICF